MARRLVLLPLLLLVLAPHVQARSLKCESQQARYDAIHAKVKKLQARVDHDGSGAVTPTIFVGDLHRLQQAKAQQKAAAKALQSCKR